MEILDRKTKTLSNKVVELVKVQQLHNKESDWTWEPEEMMSQHYPGFFEMADFADGV